MAISFVDVSIPFARHAENEIPERNKVVEYPNVDGAQVMPMGLGPQTWQVWGFLPDISGEPSKADIDALAFQTGTLTVHGTTYENCRARHPVWGQIQTVIINGWIYHTRSFHLIIDRLAY